jgi:TatD DNase family protein
MLIDTHCHIHEASYPLPLKDTLDRAALAGVGHMLCIGTSIESSEQAVAFAAQYDHVSASIGVHPHDTKDGYRQIESLADNQQVVAVGEIGLDYFYTHSPREVQIEALEWQINLALRHQLPIVFHVREAFADFWPIFDNFQGIRGELHSFTDIQQNLDAALERGLYVGINGISTFTKDATQQQLFATVPLDRVLLETDAPFLTPAPLRGKVNEPAFVRIVAEHQAQIRNKSFDEIANATTANARALFAL